MSYWYERRREEQDGALSAALSDVAFRLYGTQQADHLKTLAGTLMGLGCPNDFEGSRAEVGAFRLGFATGLNVATKLLLCECLQIHANVARGAGNEDLEAQILDALRELRDEPEPVNHNE